VTRPLVSESWHLSQFNTHGRPADPRSVVIIDCTLREGEQAPGVVLTRREKLLIARELDEAGLQEIEIGMPAVSEEEAETIGLICRSGLQASTYALCRATKDDVELAAKCGVTGVTLSLPIGTLQLEHKLHMTLEEVIERTVEYRTMPTILASE
jgi:isopropylmalate/homocitrate/citramalate synthase